MKLFEVKDKNSRFSEVLAVLLVVILFSGIIWILRDEAEADPIPNVSFSNSEQAALIGENFDLSIVLDNTGDFGYVPYLDIILPSTGIDGNDGITFVGADYLGRTLRTETLVFGSSGCVEHPYFVKTDASHEQVCGTEGDTLVVVELPFGSYVLTQPTLGPVLELHLDDMADIGTPLEIQARGGFELGGDFFNNPGTDQSIISAWESIDIIPSLAIINKNYSGEDGETATGPNFPQNYIVNVDVAAGASLDNFQITDYLDNNLEYLNFINATSGYSIVDEPTLGAPQNAPDNNLDLEWANILGTTAGVDAFVNFSFYVPQFDADHTTSSPSFVIDPDDGDKVNSENDATLGYDWTPNDPLDPFVSETDLGILEIDHVLEDRSLAVQLESNVVGDVYVSGLSAGDIVEHTIDFQISDYFAFRNLVAQGSFSDGQQFDPSFTPTLQVNTHTGSSNNIFNLANFTLSPASTSTLIFNISDELITRGQDPTIFGGCVPSIGVASSTPDCALFNGGASTGQIKFRTQILENFSNPPSGDASVDQGDSFAANVSVSGDLVDVANTGLLTGFSQSDGDSASMQISRATLSQEIYAVNGSLTSGIPDTHTGDTVTYRIQATLPTSDVEDLFFKNFLPNPVYDANELSASLDLTADASVPAAGDIKLGPNDTFHAYASTTPSIIISTGDSSLTFDYGDIDNGDISSTQTKIDILFTVTIADKAFDKNMHVTNHLWMRTGSTNNGEQNLEEIALVRIKKPRLNIKKGIVWADNPSAVLDPSNVAPVEFSTTTSVCGSRFTGTINSQALASQEIDSDADEVKGNDKMIYVVTVENIGEAVRGTFDIQIRDSLPSELQLVNGDGNLCVTDGTGALVNYTDLGGGLFGSGIELDDPSVNQGALEIYDETNGKNILVIVYDVEIVMQPERAKELENTARIFNYAALEGGVNYAASENKTDTATALVQSAVVEKTIASTNIAETTGTDVAIGELITYQISAVIPDNTTSQDVRFIDDLGNGLALVSCDFIVASSSLTFIDINGATSTPQAICDDPSFLDVSNDGKDFILNIGDIVNIDNDLSTVERVSAEYTVAVIDNGNNNPGNRKRNNVTVETAIYSISDRAPLVRIYDPRLQVEKTANPQTGDAGDQIDYTIVYQHTTEDRQKTAWELELDDTVPAEMAYIGGTLISNCSNGAVVVADDDSTPDNLKVSVSHLDIGDICTSTYSTILNVGISQEQEIIAPALLTWTSLEGDVSATQSIHNVNCHERTRVANSSASIFVASSTLNKLVATTSAAHTNIGALGYEEVVIGETVRYRLVHNLVEATALDFKLADSISESLQYIDDGDTRIAFVSNGSSTVSSSFIDDPSLYFVGNEDDIDAIAPSFVLPDASISSHPDVDLDAYDAGTDVYFRLGDVVNYDTDDDSEFIILEFNARVTNVAVNQESFLISNQFTTFEGINNFGISDLAFVEVAEPVLEFTGNNVVIIPNDAGDLAKYSLVIENTSDIIAYDLLLYNALDENLNLENVGDVTLINLPAYASSTNNTNASTNIIDFDISELRSGDSFTIEFTTRIIGTAAGGLTIPDNTVVLYTSLPGIVAGERGGSDVPNASALNNYFAESDTVVDIVLVDPGLDKKTPDPDEYTIGEQIDYEILVILPEGITKSLVVNDIVPDGLEYLAYEIITQASESAHLDSNFNGSPVVQNLNSLAGDGNDIEVTFGDVAVGATSGTENNSFVLKLIFRVSDHPNFVNLYQVENSANLDYLKDGAPETVNDVTNPIITILEPDLSIQKNIINLPNEIADGNKIRYQILVDHAVQSESPASNFSLEDILPTASFNNISNVEILANNVSTPDYAINNQTELRVPSSGTIDLPLDADLTINFDAELFDITPAEIIENTGSINYSSYSVNGRDYANSDTLTIQEGQAYLMANDDLNNLTITNVAIQINVVDNDIEPGGDFVVGGANTINLETAPAHGNVTFVGGVATYVPANNYYGEDQFKYEICNAGDCDIALVEILINNPPVAINDSEDVFQTDVVDIEIPINDSDIDGSLEEDTVQIIQQPSNGIISLTPEGVVTYDPNTGFHGTDFFTYTIQDNLDAVSNVATVSILVKAVGGGGGLGGGLGGERSPYPLIIIPEAPVIIEPPVFFLPVQPEIPEPEIVEPEIPEIPEIIEPEIPIETPEIIEPIEPIEIADLIKQLKPVETEVLAAVAEAGSEEGMSVGATVAVAVASLVALGSTAMGVVVMTGGITNPMGVSLGGYALDPVKKIELIKKMGGRFYKPKDISVQNWRIRKA